MRNHRLGKISRLQLRCDEAISSLVRNKGLCEKCGTRDGNFDTAHIIGRKNLTLRWDIFNLLCLCRKCHQEAHANPKRFTLWFQSEYPERWEYLESWKNVILKRIVEDYECLLEDIENKNLWGLIQGQRKT